MNVTVFGTGPVGRSVATRLVELTHAVAMGSRDPGNPDAAAWLASVGSHRGARVVGLAEAAAHGALLVNATSAATSVEMLEQAGEPNLHGKVLLDLANPEPDAVESASLAERIQERFPDLQVVKALNMVAPDVMTHPDRLPEETTVFVAGEDPEAKATVADLLRSFGWRSILDLGGIAAARGMEQYRPLWNALAAAQGTESFNLRVVRA
jgi:predicted dinucleotide-binding enzyme